MSQIEKKNRAANDSWQPETAVIRSQVPASMHREHATSIYMSSSFTFEDAEQARATFANEQDGYI